MTINSRAKGARGELLAAKALNETFPGCNARRGQQFAGGTDSPDVVSDLPLHLEVKSTARPVWGDWRKQLKKDAKEKPAIVLYKPSRQDFWVCVPLAMFWSVCVAVCDWMDQASEAKE